VGLIWWSREEPAPVVDSNLAGKQDLATYTQGCRQSAVRRQLSSKSSANLLAASRRSNLNRLPAQTRVRGWRQNHHGPTPLMYHTCYIGQARSKDQSESKKTASEPATDPVSWIIAPDISHDPGILPHWYTPGPGPLKFSAWSFRTVELPGKLVT
jgi:hypothetical protein